MPLLTATAALDSSRDNSSRKHLREQIQKRLLAKKLAAAHASGQEPVCIKNVSEKRCCFDMSLFQQYTATELKLLAAYVGVS